MKIIKASLRQERIEPDDLYNRPEQLETGLQLETGGGWCKYCFNALEHTVLQHYDIVFIFV